jgi:hypothetical protein
MTYRVQLLRGEPITDSEVAQTAQQLPSVSMKLLNEARLELAIIIRDNIYQSKCLQELLYTEIPEALADPEAVVGTEFPLPKGLTCSSPWAR